MATATPRHPRRSLGILALVALLLLPLTACSNKEEPLPTAAGPKATPTILTTPPATTTPSTPTPTHTAEPPRMAVPPWPKHAKEPTAEGAKAAAMYYLEDLHRYMILTGDTKPFATACPTSLEYCRFFVEGTKKLHDSGRYSFGGDVKFTKVRVGPLAEAKDYQFSANCSVEDGSTYFDDGRLHSKTKAGTFRLTATLHHKGGRWTITNAVLDNQDFG